MKHACHQVSRLASESMDRKLNVWERFRFHLHLLICKNCQQCDHALHLIHNTARLMRETRYGEIKLDEEARNQLHKFIDEKLY